jgi:hypothetical protein
MRVSLCDESWILQVLHREAIDRQKEICKTTYEQQKVVVLM